MLDSSLKGYYFNLNNLMYYLRPILLALFFNVWIWPLSAFAQTNITFTTLFRFDGINVNVAPYGQYPCACLMQGSDGIFTVRHLKVVQTTKERCLG